MRAHALMVLLSICAIVPAHAKSGAVQAKSAAEPNALTGTWEIVDAAPAPWSDLAQRPAITARGKKLVKAHVTFAAKAVSGVFACKGARYETTSYPIDSVFQASLPEPQVKYAKELGLPAGEVPGVDVNCSTGLFSYHFLNKDTALLGYNDVIYTLKRQ